MNSLSNSLAISTALALSASLGCGHSPPSADNGVTEETEHGHAHEHDHPAPTTFAAALENLVAINTEISEAFVAGDMKEADHALHEAFGAVKALGKMAEQEGFDEAAAAEVAAQSEAVLTAYDYLHGVHAGKEVDYGQVASDVEAALAKLAAVANPTDGPVEADSPVETDSAVETAEPTDE